MALTPPIGERARALGIAHSHPTQHHLSWKQPTRVLVLGPDKWSKLERTAVADRTHHSGKACCSVDSHYLHYPPKPTTAHRPRHAPRGAVMATKFFEAVDNLATAVRRSCSSVREGGGDAPSPHPEQWPESADKPALQELAGSTVKTKTGQFGFVPRPRRRWPSGGSRRF